MSHTLDPASVSVGAAGQNPFEAFLGILPRGQGLDKPFNAHDRTTWTLPSAYMGENLKLGSFIRNRVRTEANWHFLFAPVEETNQISVTWDEWIYDPSLANQIGELGVVRLLRSERSTHTRAFQHRGIGFNVEHGFMMTDQGRMHYLASLEQISQSILETLKMGVIGAYLSAQDFGKQWEAEKGGYRRVGEALAREVHWWALTQKQKRGLHVLVAEIVDAMNRYGGSFDGLIVPEKLQTYEGIIPSENLDQYLAGANGPRLVADGAQAFGRVAGKEMYVSRPFDVDGKGPVNLLRERKQIGEHYVQDERMLSTDEYRSHQRDIRIYNENEDTWKVLTLRDGIDRCELFDEDGALKDPMAESAAAMADPAGHTEASRRNQFIYHRPEDGGDELKLVEYMGQIEHRHVHPDDVAALGATARASLLRGELRGFPDAAATMSRGLELVERIESISYETAGTNGYFRALANPDLNVVGTKNTDVAGKALPPLAVLDEYVPNSATGTLSLPKKNAAWSFNVPPGMASAAGFRAMSDLHRRGLTEGWDADSLETASKFTTLLGVLTSAIRRLFPGTLVADRRYASNHWNAARDEDTVFENLIGRHRTALWLTRDEAKDFGNLTGTRADRLLGVVDTDLTRIKSYLAPVSAAGAAITGIETGYKPAADEDLDSPAVLNVYRQRAYILKTLGLVKIEQGEDSRGNDTRFTNTLAAIGRVAGGSAGDPNQTFSKADLIKELSGLPKGTLKVSPARLRTQMADVDRDFDQVAAVVSQGSVQTGDDGPSEFDLSSFRRAPLVASPTLIRSLEQYLRKNAVSNAMPSSLNQPDLVMTPAQLQAVVAAAGAQTDDDQRHAAMRTFAASREPTDFLATPLMMNLEAATSSTANVDTLTEDFGGFGAPLGGAGSSADRGYSTDASSAHAEMRGELKTPSFVKAFAMIGESVRDPLQRILAQAYLYAPVHRNVYRACAAQDVLTLLQFVYFRPHADYTSLTIIAALRGRDTARTFLGPSKFILSDDGVAAQHHGRYDFYGKPMVIQNKNVLVARNVFSDGYNGGNGVGFFRHGSYRPEAHEYGAGSIFCQALPYREGRNSEGGAVPNPLSMTGDFTHVPELANMDLEDARPGVHTHTMAGYYDAMWGFSGRARASGLVEQRFAGAAAAAPNYVTYRGHTERRGPNGDFTDVDPGTGHWGANGTYIGCNRVRAGKLLEFAGKQ